MKIGKRLTIDFKSFTKKSPKKIKDEFGVFLITGYQGSGKTYIGVYFLVKYFKDLKIKTNIHSLNIPDYNIEYFDTIDEIVDDIEPHCIYLIDEISKKYTKECKQDKLFYSWLQQSRKRMRYVLLITQEYLQVPFWLRGVASMVYTTTKIKGTKLFKTYKGIPYLDDETKEWGIEPVSTYIYKRNKAITDLYDTFEPVNIL